MVALRLTLLGGFDARLATGDAVSVPTKKAQALLTYLGLRPGQTHQRDKLAALLWGERSDERARDGLRHALVALRKALPGIRPPLFLAEGQTLTLNAAVVEVDVATFERRVAQGTPGALEQAAELYRGDLLLGFTLNEPLFEEWLVAERERLREVALEALARLLAHQTKSGGTERAIQTAVRLLALDPLQEPVHRALMRLYVRQGRRGAALKQYQLCVSVLQRELGTEPEAETKQLYQKLLQRPVAGVRTAAHHETRAPSRAFDRGGARLDLPIPEVPLVGRDAELAALLQAVDGASRGEGRIAVVIGEAGIGKSALLGALAAHVLARSMAILVGRAHESDQILAFGPWVQAFRAEKELFDDLFVTLEPVWRAELARLLPEFDAPSLPPASGSDLRLFEGVTHVIERLAALCPLLLVLEDFHWADAMSLRLLAYVGRRLHRWGVLVVVTAREEELLDAPAAGRTLEELCREGSAIRLVLSPLPRPDTLQLVRNLGPTGGDVPGLSELEDAVWRVSEGNPLAAVETTRAFQQAAVVQESTALSLPQRVRELVASRLDRLTEGGRQLAAVAAVIGSEFEFALLQRASGLAEEATAEGIEELVRRRVLQGVGEHFDFTHDRIRAVVDGQLLAPRRKLLHRRIGEAIEALHADRLEPHVLSLGLHYRDAEVWDKAVAFLRRAGTTATARGASREAVACFGEALRALEHLAETPDTIRLAIDLRLDLQSEYVLLGELPLMLASLREAESLAQAVGDRSRLARVWAHMVSSLWWMGQLENAVDYGQRALAIATDLEDRSLEILARARLGLAYLYLGQHRLVIDVVRPCIEALSGDLARERFEMAALPAVMGRGYLAISLASLGDFVAASTISEEALAIAKAADHPYSVALAHFHEGRWRALRGNFSAAIPALEMSLEACRREGFHAFIIVAAFLGGAYARVGRLADGIALLQESVERETAIAFMVHRPANLAFLAEAYLLSGRYEEALQTAHHALDLSRAGKRRGFEADVLYILGAIESQQDPSDRAAAEEFYRQALALAEELGLRPLVAHCHLGLANLYRRMSKWQEAQNHLTTALTMYREMGMSFWSEKAKAAGQDIDAHARQTP